MVTRLWAGLLVLCLVLTGCSGHAEEKQRRSFFAMDTYMTMTACGPEAEAGLKSAEARIRQIESELSVTDPGSEVYRVNHGSGTDIPVGKDTEETLGTALALAEETGGALDPTLYPVVEAWGFTRERQQVPADEALREAMARTGWERLRLAEGTLHRPEGMEIDLGAVGKGYAGREAGRVLRAHGVTSAILSLGGNIEAVGARPDGTPWRVGIRAPDAEGHAGMLSVRDAAVVTSGSYERYFKDDSGKRWHHILDPASGYPAENGLLSVTVAGPDGLLCDGLSTALFVMGRDKAEAFWRAHGGFEMILIGEGRHITVTEGLAEQFTVLPEYTAEKAEVLRR